MENLSATTCFFQYMWNYFNREESHKIWGKVMGNHFYDKYQDLRDKYGDHAAISLLYAEMTEHNRHNLIQAACERINPTLAKAVAKAKFENNWKKEFAPWPMETGIETVTGGEVLVSLDSTARKIVFTELDKRTMNKTKIYASEIDFRDEVHDAYEKSLDELMEHCPRVERANPSMHR